MEATEAHAHLPALIAEVDRFTLGYSRAPEPLTLPARSWRSSDTMPGVHSPSMRSARTPSPWPRAQ
jgi:hypothetical protein